MRIYDGRDYFYQWDTERKITSPTFKVGDEIHFWNIRQPTALTVLAYEENGKVIANVPNILLQNSFAVKAFRYIRQDDGSITVDEHQFEVIARPRPSDYVYTETEILSYRTLSDRIDKLENDETGGTDSPGGSTNLPTGGKSGQVLAKASDADNDLTWKDPITYLEVSNNSGGKTVTIGGV